MAKRRRFAFEGLGFAVALAIAKPRPCDGEIIGVPNGVNVTFSREKVTKERRGEVPIPPPFEPPTQTASGSVTPGPRGAFAPGDGGGWLCRRFNRGWTPGIYSWEAG